jgi:hypothetical protein
VKSALRRLPVRGIAPWFAATVIAAHTLAIWRTQYVVDAEATLLPWLMSKGWVLYRDAIDQHPPLWTFLLSITTRGDPGLPSHLAVTVLNVLATLLVYKVAARFSDAVAGLAAVALYAIWSLPFEATHLWYDSTLALVYLAVLLFFPLSASPWIDDAGQSPVAARLRWRALALGLLLGIGILIKQHAVIAVPFVALALWLVSRPRAVPSLLIFLLGLMLPVALVSGVYAALGAFNDFWYWTVQFSISGRYTGADLPVPESEWPVLVALYLSVPALLLATPLSVWGRPRTYTWIIGLGGMLVAATLAEVPRYGRFHLQAAVPLLAVLGGNVLVSGLRSFAQKQTFTRITAVLALWLLALSVLVGVSQWLMAASITRATGQPRTPYTDITALRTWVDSKLPPGAPMLVLGLDSTIYRLLEREPPRPWIPEFRWIRAAHHSHARFWDGVLRTRPGVVLLTVSRWESPDTFDPQGPDIMIPMQYHEAARFELRSYPLAPPFEVVALLRDDDQQP